MTSSRRAFILGSLSLLPLAACSSGGDSTGSSSGDPRPTAWTSSAPKATSSQAAKETADLRPTRLEISSITLDEKVRALGLSNNGFLEPPAHVVQWYNASPAPGEPGYSILAGHVTFDGPDTFVNLRKVAVGNEVFVTHADGKRQRFVVTKTERVDKEKLRHRQDVWGSTKNTMLVLITCDDRSPMHGQHHTDNFVVWAKPA